MFRFKQFSVNDSHSTMKVGTDAVLLGTWVENVDEMENILEIGTGCGVISLILAQRMSESHILAIDIDEDSVKEAAENFQESSFSNRLKSKHIAVQDYLKLSSEKFSLIVSNPPFFQNSLQSKTHKKILARHSSSLSFEELLHCVSGLLLPSGRFCCILPFAESERFLFEAEMNSLSCEKRTSVYTRAGQQNPQLALFSFRKKTGETSHNNLTIKDSNENYTPEYLDMTKDFYLFAE